MKMNHYLCQKHSERTFKKFLVNDVCEKIREHIYAVFYFKRIFMKCEKSIKAVINVAFIIKRVYIKRE